MMLDTGHHSPASLRSQYGHIHVMSGQQTSQHALRSPTFLSLRATSGLLSHVESNQVPKLSSEIANDRSEPSVLRCIMINDAERIIDAAERVVSFLEQACEFLHQGAYLVPRRQHVGDPCTKQTDQGCHRTKIMDGRSCRTSYGN